MAPFLEGYPWSKEPLYNSEAPQPVDEIIVAGSDQDESPLTEAERRRKRELIGQRYLRGHVPLIQSAQLLGPFHRNSGWSNTWRSSDPKATTQPLVGAVVRKHTPKVDKPESSTLRNDSILHGYSSPAPSEHDADDADDEHDGLGYDDKEILHHDDSHTTEASYFNSQLRRSQALENDFNTTLEKQEAGRSFMGFKTSKPGFAQGGKRKAEANEDWLKGAHLIKRSRREMPLHSTPTPSAGAVARRRNRNRPEMKLSQTTTPAQSRLQSPNANSIAADILEVDALADGQLVGSSGFTPLRSSGQPTPPSESPQKTRKRRPIVSPGEHQQKQHWINDHDANQSPTIHKFGSGQLPEVSMDNVHDHSDRKLPDPPSSISPTIPAGSFKYQRMKLLPATSKRTSSRKTETTLSNQNEFSTGNPVTRSLSPDREAWINVVQKRVVTFSDVDSPGITSLTRERHNRKRAVKLRQSSLPERTLVHVASLEHSPIEDGDRENAELGLDNTTYVCDKEEEQIDGNKQSSEERQPDDLSDLMMEVVQSQLLSEANDYPSEEPTPSITPVIARNPSPSGDRSLGTKRTAGFNSVTASEDITSSYRDGNRSNPSPQDSSHRICNIQGGDNRLLESRISYASLRGQHDGNSSPNSDHQSLREAHERSTQGFLKEEELMTGQAWPEGLQDIESTQGYEGHSPEFITERSSWAHLKSEELMKKPGLSDGLQNDDSTQSVHQSAVEDDMSNMRDVHDQSPWALSSTVNIKTKSTSPNILEDDECTQECDLSPRDGEMDASANGAQQSPWALTSLLPPVAFYRTVDAEPQDGLEVVDFGERARDNLTAEGVVSDYPGSLTSSSPRENIPTMLDPFTSTQVLVEAARANPWTSSNWKRKRGGREKRVSWGPLPSEDTNGDFPATSLQFSKHLSSPPPPQRPLAFADSDDTFHQFLKAPACLTPLRDSSDRGAFQHAARAVLRHLTCGTSTDNSPAIDAMAEAFITADGLGSHDSHDTASKAEQENARPMTSEKGPASVKKWRDGSSEVAARSRVLSPTSFSITPSGNVTALGSAKQSAFDEDEELGAAIDDIGSFLQGWDVDTELKKADKGSNGNGWRTQEYLPGV